jgi:hypothetical protein
MSRFADNPVIVPDRELEEEKKPGRVGTAAHPMPALWLVARERSPIHRVGFYSATLRSQPPG